jgi:prevent-host-death family protein
MHSTQLYNWYGRYMSVPQVKISDARTRLADIVRDAERDEPTVITQNGHPAAVVIGFEEWRQLAAARDAQIWAEIQSRRDEPTHTMAEVIDMFAEQHGLSREDVADA